MPLLPHASRLPTIDTPRLRLRWLTRDDVPALFALFSHPEVCRFWSRPPMTDVADAAALQADITHCFGERSLFQWGVAERDTDAVVGTCTLARLSVEHGRAEIGFALARQVWGRGYVAELMPALLTFAFETLGLERIEADVDPRNGRSSRALEREGFRREGYLRERYRVAGEVQDSLLYGLLRREWRRPADPVLIREIASRADLEVVRELFREYATSLGVDLSFQQFEEELAGLPGAYVRPGGGLWLARARDRVVGCVAVRPLGDGLGEIKRLYVRPDGRGAGAGRALAQVAIAFGHEAGYRALRLDTLADMTAARALYARLGFASIPPYRYNPLPGTDYMELKLRADEDA